MGKNKHFSNIDVAICKVEGNKYYSLSDLSVTGETLDFDVEEAVDSEYVIILNPWTDKIVLPVTKEQIIELSLVNQKFLTTVDGLEERDDLIFLIAAKKIYANTNLIIIENKDNDKIIYNFYRNKFFKNNQPTFSIAS